MGREISDNSDETRALSLYGDEAAEVRIERVAGKSPRLAGYAARFNVLSRDLGGFRERILPTAFDAALAKGADIRALVDHDHSKLLGRTSAGTLSLGKDERGLWFQLDMPDTQYSRDVQTLVERGDIRGMSFGFRLPRSGERFTREDGSAVRELVQDIDLKEITVTSLPAYEQTSLQLRVDPGIAQRIPPIARPRLNRSRRWWDFAS